jgi:hypothetical protein
MDRFYDLIILVFNTIIVNELYLVFVSNDKNHNLF